MTVGHILGLDLGSNSIGWALVDEEQEIVAAAGVRVFPEGVDRDTSGAEHAKNEGRRMARGHRRQIARRSRRKAVMRKALIEARCFTSNSAEDQPAAIIADPYALRSRGLDEKLTLEEFGRVLLHLNQRRGFLSNRKADRGKDNEKSETLQSIKELQAKIEAEKCRTLGEYLHKQRTSVGDVNKNRIRNQHTRREMFEQEFELLWEAQRRHHPLMLTDQLKYGRQGKRVYPRDPEPLKKRKAGNTLLQEFGFHGIIFFQRSLYWPKSVVGRCELEPGEKRCERADRQAQRFRLLNEVNNLRVIPQKGEIRPLTPDERTTLVKYLSGTKEATFEQIAKKLGLLEGDSFNLAAGSRTKLHGVPVDAALANKKYFGPKWYDRPEAEKNAIVRSLINDEEPELIRKATSEWGCSPEVAELLARMDITSVAPGYASYGITAIKKLLPHLEKGLLVMSRDGTPSALQEAGYLRPDQRKVVQGQHLPLPSDRITNPLVRQALFEVRKIIHAIIREWGMPKAIHIELAREVQGNGEQRRKASMQMRLREKRREDAADRLREHGGSVRREAIDRYLLWEEQGKECLYSGRPISMSQLLGGEVDVDHILPYSKSLDNSLMNRAVVFRDENRLKGKCTVFEWLGECDKFNAILQRAARHYPYEIRNRKLAKLKQPTVELNDFLNRQLSDTAYLTTQVLDLLRHLDGVDLVPVKGQLTFELRHFWGLDSVLNPTVPEMKNREDHRHHAVDAIVIALTSRSRLQLLAARRYTDQEVPPPWAGFRGAVETVVNRINVSHRPVRDLNGALHEETIYGPTSKPHRASQGDRPHAQGWIEEEGVFVVRKNLADLTPAMVPNIRDAQIRRLVQERLQSYGIEPGSKQKPPKDWHEELYMSKDGKPDKDKRAHQIRKVRITRKEATIRPIRGGTAWVKPGNNHHIAIFALPGSSPSKPKREMIAVSMMEAAQRVRNRQPLIARTHPTVPEAKFLFSLSWGEMIWANIRGQEGLYVFRTAASTQGQIYFVPHTDARPSSSVALAAVKANTLNGHKVRVDLLGRIQRAND